MNSLVKKINFFLKDEFVKANFNLLNYEYRINNKIKTLEVFYLNMRKLLYCEKKRRSQVGIKIKGYIFIKSKSFGEF